MKGTKVVYINSYHQGYSTSDRVENIIVDYLDSAQLNYRVFRLDFKRITLEEERRKVADSVFEVIKKIEPDFLICSDDPAVSYIAEPFSQNTEIPILFCGVNWSKESYSLNENEVRGILEVLPLMACIDTVLNYFPNSKHIGILSENSLSEKNNTIILDTLYKNCGLIPTYRLVNNFEEWKISFFELNKTCDIVYLPTNGAIKNWDNEAARIFVQDNIKKPIITCDDFMMDYSVFGMTKIVEEQGGWVVQNLDKLIHGGKITDIKNSSNSGATYYWSPVLAEKVGFHPDAYLKEKLNIYNNIK
ncbi:MAG: hypothetical protein JXB49_32415 [Bacteroidales bacterium]|nr:hypothetical protein [Bacteroidales bacterium]